mmetsp:Transcript_41663/g.87415  ORF Transcript_41663/g.87415 Transcript_41663/m.87415 type:complete len:83 (+) Transcript_41663:137-385(+)
MSIAAAAASVVTTTALSIFMQRPRYDGEKIYIAIIIVILRGVPTILAVSAVAMAMHPTVQHRQDSILSGLRNDDDDDDDGAF